MMIVLYAKCCWQHTKGENFVTQNFDIYCTCDGVVGRDAALKFRKVACSIPDENNGDYFTDLILPNRSVAVGVT